MLLRLLYQPIPYSYCCASIVAQVLPKPVHDVRMIGASMHGQPTFDGCTHVSQGIMQQHVCSLCTAGAKPAGGPLPCCEPCYRLLQLPSAVPLVLHPRPETRTGYLHGNVTTTAGMHARGVPDDRAPQLAVPQKECCIAGSMAPVP